MRTLTDVTLEILTSFVNDARRFLYVNTTGSVSLKVSNVAVQKCHSLLPVAFDTPPPPPVPQECNLRMQDTVRSVRNPTRSSYTVMCRFAPRSTLSGASRSCGSKVLPTKKYDQHCLVPPTPTVKREIKPRRLRQTLAPTHHQERLHEQFMNLD
ncbi:hypothetical protein F2P81_018394 [Scophthalmus maximus]|uniref:Uncharacterized protein n=1 Tax=Scophthalmus maximus TaxID=52904 RepID=A0A6A4S9P3_SCOMX|nr:hypothetical protein F2P81_018394 [Scophthalmus maximus]